MQLTEKRKSPLTSIATAVLDPYAANFWLQKINPLWSVNQSLGKIVKKDTAAQGVVSFTLQFNKKFQVGAAGQHHQARAQPVRQHQPPERGGAARDAGGVRPCAPGAHPQRPAGARL